MRAQIESYLLNPPPGSAASRAAEFGIDLTLTIGNLKLTPEERIQRLDKFIEGVSELRESTRKIWRPYLKINPARNGSSGSK